jgi:cyclohexyl-isocyanide hydratase
MASAQWLNGVLTQKKFAFAIPVAQLPSPRKVASRSESVYTLQVISSHKAKREAVQKLAADNHLHIGAILFPRMDQADFTGPFEILSRIPNSTFHVLAKTKTPIIDARGLILTPQMTLSEAPQLDLLLIPGGGGVNELMEDETVLSFIRKQAAGAKFVLSVCTGALVCGAAGLLKGRRATTHWASFHLLEEFGAIPVNTRVVVEQNLVSTAGVTAGMDGALRIAALLRGERAAHEIQLYIQYAPEPPFNSGDPRTAPAEVLQESRASMRELIAARTGIVKRAAAKLGR